MKCKNKNTVMKVSMICPQCNNKYSVLIIIMLTHNTEVVTVLKILSDLETVS